MQVVLSEWNLQKTLFNFNEYCADEFYMWGGFNNNGNMYFVFGFYELYYNKILYETKWDKFEDRNLLYKSDNGSITSGIKSGRIMYDYTKSPGYSFRYTLLDQYGRNMGQIIFTQQSDESDPNIEFRPGSN